MIARLAAAVLAVVALGCVAAAMIEPDPSSATERSTLATPVWSARRVPGPIAGGVAQLRLQSELGVELGEHTSCMVVDGSPGRLVSYAADAALIPASTIKVLTAIGALEILPADFTFTTRVSASGEVVAGEVSSVTLEGGGDPLLGTPEWIAARGADPRTAGTATTPLAALADQVAAAGIRSIPQGVIGVAPRWPGEPAYLPSWPESYWSTAIGPMSSLTVNGGFRSVGGPAADPALLAAEELTRLLRERGIAVGPPTVGTDLEPAAAVASVESAPLPELVAEMLAVSDNLTAETMLRELAVATGGASTEHGAAAVREQLARLGLPVDGLVQVDGSGLSRDNRVPCSLLQAALGLTNRPELAIVRDGLAVAGERGTLADRLAGTPLTGQLRAKTGTLPGVSGLAGFVEVGPSLQFSLLVNGEFSQSSGLLLRERITLILAEFPDVPPIETLVPPPAAPTR